MVANTMPEEYWSRLSERIAEHMGLYFPPDRLQDLRRGILAAASDLQFEDPEQGIEKLLASPLTRQQVEVLAAHLGVGETYFFRDPNTVEALREHILPGLIAARSKAPRCLRIWVAGCASGEEAYSAAMLLDEALPDRQEWQVTLLATDINPHSLRKAAQGTYGKWSFRGTPDWVRAKWFTPHERGRLQVIRSLRERVTFAYLNLAEDVFPSFLTNTAAMDLILCRNVLMYFTPAVAAGVVDRFQSCLTEGGWLVVSPVEVSLVARDGFATERLCERILFRKRTGSSQRAAPKLASVSPPDQLAPTEFSISNRVTSSSFRSRPSAEPSSNQSPQPEPESRPTCTDSTISAKADFAAQAGEQALRAEPVRLQARLLADRGDLAAALALCDQATAADALDRSAHFLRAEVLLEQGSLEEARRSLERVLYLDPDFVLAHFLIGHIALRQARGLEARRHFENVLSLVKAYAPGELLPESEGMTAGRVEEIVRSTIAGGLVP